jgi:rod shape-determining protein MreC
MHAPPSPSSLSSRRALGALVLVTVLVSAVDLARPASTSVLRGAAASALGPLERAVAVGGDARLARVTAERDELARRVAADRDAAAAGRRLTALLGSTSAARVVPARVIAFGGGVTTGARRVTLDVGSRDGLAVDLPVVAADGLVGRVVAVSDWTSDVAVLGDRDVTVGVRVGARGTLGAVAAGSATATPGSATAGAPPRAAGRLGLTLVQQGTVRAGEVVTTLGSVGGGPYPPGLRVGTVTSVDPPRGQLTATASVRPAVDPTTLDVVGVLLPTTRAAARPPVAGTAP